LGGTTVGGQPGLESAALRLALPEKGGGGGGMYLPSIVVVALGEPGTPVVSCAITGMAARSAMTLGVSDSTIDLLFFLAGPMQDFAIAKVVSDVSSAVELHVLRLNDMTGS
jgi:hypothetical protein